MRSLEFDRAHLWRFRARLLSVTDGDTFRAELDLGCYARYEARIRLAGFSAPETHEDGGDVATDRLARLLGRGISVWPLRVTTLQRETVVSEVRSFERYVAHVLIEMPDGELVDVVELLR